jgi:phage tail protein X
MQLRICQLTLVASIVFSSFARAEPVISEILASNSSILADADGEFPDWIEIHNPDDSPVELKGYALTDNERNLTKWALPSVTLEPGAFLVVFASGKNRSDPEKELHTDFRLSSGGEYLALVKPDGKTITTEFKPKYPEQFQDESYGPGVSADSVLATIVASGAEAKWIVPSEDIGEGWRELEFDDAAWQSGATGLGYGFDELTSESGDLENAMKGVNATAYARIPFEISNAAEVIRMTLRLKYEDGFAAWLNGRRIAADREPELPQWNSTATATRSDSLAEEWEEYSVELAGNLETGTNVLAVQILNKSAGGSDVLFLPEIDVETVDSNLPLVTGYLLEATPGAPNAQASSNGPRIFNATNAPAINDPAKSVLVTALIQENLAPVGSAAFRYRVMYEDEATLPMVDDGTAGDQTAGDGIYSATIPGGIAEYGQMLRWAIVATDIVGAETRSPRFPDEEGSPEYFGTVVIDPAVVSKLPVLHRFVERASRAEARSGTRASVYYNGEFYDNVFIRQRGGTAASWPKKSYKLDFNQGSHFRFRDGVPRVDEINLNAPYTDKSYVRALLTAEVGNDAGTPSPETFHFRMHQNGEFYSVAYFVEQPDKDFLRRHGLDSLGALYKGPPGANLDSARWLEKKTNKETRAKDDLRDFIAGIRLRDIGELEQFVFDNVDIPAQVNFIAVVAITQNIDATDKNYFIYRDTFGTGEWQMLPWDLDLTFGPNALNTDTIVTSADRNNGAPSHVFIGSPPHVLSGGKLNRLIDAVVKTERTKDMLLRRIRTLADEFLATDYFFTRIDELNALLAAEVVEDREKWGSRAHFGGRSYTLQEATDRIKNEYLIPRLEYLTVDQAVAFSSGLTFIEGDGSPVKAHVPRDPALGTSWTAIGFDDSNWIEGTGGVGFERGSSEGYLPLMGIDLQSDDLPAELRFDTNGDGVDESGSVYMRYPFDVPDPTAVGGLEFSMKYDDGYVAYLNGTKVAEKNAPDAPDWDSIAARSHSDSKAIIFENTDLSGSKSLLVKGRNVLAIHGMNQSLTNSDLIFVPRLADEGSGSDDAVGIPPAQAADARVEFGKLHGAGTPAEHYLEIVNPGERSVDISGWKISGSIKHTFKAGTVVLPGGRLYLSPDVRAFRSRPVSPTGGETHFVQGNYSGQLRDGEAVSLLNQAETVVATATPQISAEGFSEWIARFFPPGSPESAPDADPDLDGSTNTLEFALATDPGMYSIPDIKIARIDVEADPHLAVTFVRPTGTTVLYSLEQSATMMADTWSVLQSSQTSAVPLPGDAGVERVTLQTTAPVSSTSLYVRLRAVIP